MDVLTLRYDCGEISSFCCSLGSADLRFAFWFVWTTYSSCNVSESRGSRGWRTMQSLYHPNVGELQNSELGEKHHANKFREKSAWKIADFCVWGNLDIHDLMIKCLRLGGFPVSPLGALPKLVKPGSSIWVQSCKKAVGRLRQHQQSSGISSWSFL